MKSKASHQNTVRELLIIVVAYILLSPTVAMPLYNKMLFFPDSHDYEQAIGNQFQKLAGLGCQKRDVNFTAQNGNRLHGWIFLLPSAKRIIQVNHGNGGNIASRLNLAEALLKSGNSVFLYDYQGYGRSQGQPTVTNICDDSICAFDYLVAKEKFEPQNIIAYGESIGTGATCVLSDRRKPCAIILQSGFPSLVYVARDRLWFMWLYPSDWFPQLDCQSTVKRPHPPLAIIHGKDDPFFPPQYAQRLYRSAVELKELTIIENMGHAVENADNLAFHEAMMNFLNKLPKAN